MIPKKCIDEIYKKYRKRTKSTDELNLSLLFSKLPAEAKVAVSDTAIILGTVDECSPFHEILLKHVNGIVDFIESVAIILPSSILFISKDNGEVHVHIKDITPSIMDRIRGFKSGPSF